MNSITQFFEVTWAKLGSLLDLFNQYGNAVQVLAILVATIGALLGATPIARWFRTRGLLRRCKPKLGEYIEGEREKLRGLPSLVANEPIDFGTHGEYVSLVLVEQSTKRTLAAKRAVDVKDVLASRTPIVVVSGPGYGKTTLLRHMQFMLLERHSHEITYRERSIPFFFSASEIPTSEVQLKRLLAERLVGLDNDDGERFAEIGITNGWFTVFIDGVDEIEGSIPGFLTTVTGFVRHSPKCHFVLASRPVSYDLELLTQHANRPFTEVAIAPLSRDRKIAIAAKYSNSEEHFNQVMSLIDEHEFLGEITRVTINLVLLVSLVADSKDLSCRSDFYRHASRRLLDELPKRKGQHLEWQFAEKTDLLGRVSFKVLTQRKDFSGETIESCGIEPTKAAKIFDEICRTSGMVKLIALGKYAFPHRTFAEYFAALHVVASFDRITLHEWQELYGNETSEIIAFVANLIPSVDSLVSMILKLHIGRPRLLAICLANCNSVSIAIQREAERMIWDSLKDSPEVQVQSSAARHVLALIHRFPRQDGYETLYDALVNRLSFADQYSDGSGSRPEDVQIQSLRLLVHTSSPTIVPCLVRLLQDGKTDTYVRFKAGELLAAMSTDELVPDLRKAYDENSDDDVRRFIVQAIVRTGSKNAMPAIEAAFVDGDPVIRDLATVGYEYVDRGLYLDEATIVLSSNSPNREKLVVPGCDLSPNELLTVAADISSDYRLDAFFRLRATCPDGREQELFDLAANPEENEFYRCEAVRLLGTRKSDMFAEYLERVFRNTRQPNTPENGAGARGCAIEYLAHRECVSSVFNCLSHCDIRSCLPSEQCKIMWAMFEIVRTIDRSLTAAEREVVRRLCSECDDSENPRVGHWRDRATNMLARQRMGA